MDEIKLPAEDVFTLLNVPVPENIISLMNQGQSDKKDDVGNESEFSLDDDDKVIIKVCITFYNRFL